MNDSHHLSFSANVLLSFYLANHLDFHLSFLACNLVQCELQFCTNESSRLHWKNQHGSPLYICICSTVQLKILWIIKVDVLQKTILKQIRKWIIHCFAWFAAGQVFYKACQRLDRSLPTRSCRNIVELALCFPLWAVCIEIRSLLILVKESVLYIKL